MKTAPTLAEIRASLASPLLGRLILTQFAFRHVDEVIQQTEHPGLDYLASGTRPPNPTKLVESERFHELVAELSRRYELIVFDTPPLAAAFDGTLISAQVDGAIMVVSAGSTHRGIARKSLTRLLSVPSVNFLGVVLNRAETSGFLRQVFRDYMSGPSASDRMKWAARERSSSTKASLQGAPQK